MAIAKALAGSAVDSSNSTTYTFTSLSLGTAAADRYIAVLVHASTGTAGRSSTAVSVGNSPATKIVERVHDGALAQSLAAIWLVSVPQTASADVVVTFSGQVNDCGVTLLAITGMDGSAATATSGDTADPCTTTINVPANGILIACSEANASSQPTCAWTGPTENYETTIESLATMSGASQIYATAQTGLTVTADWSNGTQASAVMACAAFAPAGINVGVTGVSTTGVAGNVGVSASHDVQGVQGNAVGGILGPSFNKLLTGVQASGAAGQVQTGRGAVLQGVLATGAVGNFSTSIFKSLIGVSGSAQVGQLSVAAQATLVGVAGTAALGSLTVYNSAILDALLQSGEFKMADLYTIILADGVTALRYTTADIDIVAGGNTFSAVKGKVQRGELIRQVGVQVDEFEVKFLPDPDEVLFGKTFANQARLGLFDGCSFRVERAFMPTWGDVSAGTVLIFVGEDAAITAGRSTVTFQAHSLLQRLNVQIPPNVFQASCLHTLYDAGCGLSKAALTVNTTVRSGATTTFIPINAVNGAGHFDQGTVLFLSGPNQGQLRTIKKWDGNGLFLSLPLPEMPAAGDLVGVAPGCDRLQSTCLNKFNNLAQFRATPYVPVPETAV